MQPSHNNQTMSSPEHERPARHDLVVGLRISKTNQEIALPPCRRLVLGRAHTCDVTLADPRVSAVHCTLERRDGRLIVHDQRSKNGVFINGCRVDTATLAPGSRLRVGSTVLVAMGERGDRRRSACEALCGEDPTFVRAVELAVRAGAADCSVLVVGETGTGKELVARAVHDASPRTGGPFVAVNCGGLTPNLVGSELFGHVRGAFTGADSTRDGVFLQADGGTLFLDELGELPLDQQPHLLRVLETGAVRRIGGNEEVPVDVRLVSATNRTADLGTPDASLRLDLFHRLATIVVALPPLRARRGDIPLLVDAFSRELAGEPRPIARATMRALEAYAWPGNVRQLRKAVERAVALSPDELLLEHLLPDPVGSGAAAGSGLGAPAPELDRAVTSAVPSRHRRALRSSGARDGRDDRPDGGDTTMDAMVRDLMLDALDRHGSIRAAARALGMAKSTFADRARRLGIDLQR